MPDAVAEKQPQEHFAELRAWVLEHCNCDHPVRQAAYQMALTAIVHRTLKYGPDETLNHLTSRDLLNLLIYTNGLIAEWLMRSAFTRAIVENDTLVYEHLAQTPFMAECTAWYWKLVQGMLGGAPDPKELTDWLDALPAEEKSLARLMIARLFPDTVHVDWLNDVPAECPAIAAQLARICGGKKEYQHAVMEWVRQRPNVRNQAFA